MSEEITLNGVKLSDLKKTKALIQKDASKFIADGLKDVAILMQSIKDFELGEDEDECVDIEAAALAVKDKLENIRLVSGVSDVQYYLPYSDEGYYNETPYSRVLEDAGIDSGAVDELQGLLEDMESQSRGWHRSNC